MSDIVFVSPETFAVDRTVEIAREIADMNARLTAAGRKYLLVGPGRWGSSDRWLGIPVGWNDICGVAAIVETTVSQLRVEPSQGSHFFIILRHWASTTSWFPAKKGNDLTGSGWKGGPGGPEWTRRPRSFVETSAHQGGWPDVVRRYPS